MLKASTATNKDPDVTHLPAAQNTGAHEAAQTCSKSAPERNKLHRCANIKLPLPTESAVRKTDNHTTLVFTVDVKASKHPIQQAVKKLHDTDVAKVNTLIRPDGEKKAYV